MKLSDYLVTFFVERGIKDFFGYQGTMIAHVVDSICKNPEANNHSCYNEQGAAFAACGYARVTEGCAVAYATSGPGAINLISGIANAYYDSLPVVFISGQINTYETRYDIPELRQSAFQEIKMVDICKPITKYAVQITDENTFCKELEKAYKIANEGRPGPVVIDLPMNIQRAEITIETTEDDENDGIRDLDLINESINKIREAVETHNRPVFLFGNGLKRKSAKIFVELARQLHIPIITSLLGKDLISGDDELNFGFLGGAYGHRYANMIISAKCDLIVSVGCSLCTRQTGTKTEMFAPGADLIRIEIDPIEAKRKVKDREIIIPVDCNIVATILDNHREDWLSWKQCSLSWMDFCKRYKSFTEIYDNSLSERDPNRVVSVFNQEIRNKDIVVCDVGQHMMWIGQSILSKSGRILFSGGHGAMGYALPAAIGASIAEPNATVYCFCGDGGMQMNIQELQWIVRERLNIIIIVLNNHSLGLITQQQDKYFSGKHYGADKPGFTVPDYTKIAKAYGIHSIQICQKEQISNALHERKENEPFLLEYSFSDVTRAVPKTELGQPIYNQEPLLPQKRLEEYLNEDIKE